MAKLDAISHNILSTWHFRNAFRILMVMYAVNRQKAMQVEAGYHSTITFQHISLFPKP